MVSDHRRPGASYRCEFRECHDFFKENNPNLERGLMLITKNVCGLSVLPTPVSITRRKMRSNLVLRFFKPKA